ncbi:MAG: DUF1501 domain-containing protein [Actinomycetota bacterium]|nr:DUF1501 domain-containing protein [Actinomycetota bacterium]
MAEPCLHCADFSRARLLRQAAAQAGSGLPTVEPGMPLPAGTGLSRRSFLMRSAGLALSVYGVSALGPRSLEEGIARAASGPAGPVLVSVFLEGGADSLSLLFPDGESDYRRLRPTLALAPGSGLPFGEDDRLRWHPALEPLAGLHAEGKVTTLPAIGYTHVDQSHFTSCHYWEVGATSTQLTTGWMGRYLDHVGSDDNPLQGLSLDGQLQPALAAAQVPVAALADPASYTLAAPHVSGEVERRMLETVAELGAARESDDQAVSAARKATLQSTRVREQLLEFDGFTSPVPYPDGGGDPFPKRLAGLAAMIGAGLPVRCAAVKASGLYDTHANQPDALTRGLLLTAGSLAAFQRDLEARGLADRVLVYVWSEFGRRAQENASFGTDHGAAGTGFLIGSRVRGHMIGEFPGLAQGLDENGNLRATSDFRGVYCALLEQWFGTDAAAVIPNAAGFTRPELLR